MVVLCVVAAPGVWGQAASSAASDGAVEAKHMRIGESLSSDAAPSALYARALYLAPATAARWMPITDRRPSASDYWIEIAAGTVAVAAMALSIHYKFQADDYYDSYVATGDPALQPLYKAYDRRALVALGVGQVGLGVLAVRLATR